MDLRQSEYGENKVEGGNSSMLSSDKGLFKVSEKNWFSIELWLKHVKKFNER